MVQGGIGRRRALALAVGLPLMVGRAGRAVADGPGNSAVRYTMTVFTNASETDLYVYESDDAINFRLLSGPAYRPPVGVMRDPSIFRHVDGDYYLTYTASGGGQVIGFARSSDLVSWKHLYDFPIPMPGVEACWAPEWFVDGDGSVSVIVSLSSGHGFTPHLLTAADASLRSWNAMIPMAGLGPNLFALNPLGYIDTTLVRHAGRYFAFTKNETTKFIELACAFNPTGPYLVVASGDWAGWGTLREGPSVVRLDDGGWRIFFDAYTEGKYFYSDSHDDFRTWTAPRELPGLSGTIRHGTVLREGGPPSEA